MAKFILFKGSNQQYYFHLKADNGEKVLGSEGYTTKQSCLNGIDSVKGNVGYDSRYEKRTSVSDNYYFNLRAWNNEVIGTSEMYSSAQARDNGIGVVKRIAPLATTEDNTVATASHY
jgi:uncharacterized protein YegP (UPF0339 family)